MHCEAARFHDNVVIDGQLAGVPRCYFLHGPPKRDGEFFVAGLEGAIAKFDSSRSNSSAMLG